MSISEPQPEPSPPSTIKKCVWCGSSPAPSPSSTRYSRGCSSPSFCTSCCLPPSLRHGTTPRIAGGPCPVVSAVAISRPTSDITPELVPPVTTSADVVAVTITSARRTAASSSADSLNSFAPPVTLSTTDGRGSFQYFASSRATRPGGVDLCRRR